VAATDQGEGGSHMSQAEQERSQEQREASDSEAEQVQQFGAVFYITVAISAVFVLAGVFFTEPFGSARDGRWLDHIGSRLVAHAHDELLPRVRRLAEPS
jgi:hypothetical protein